MGAAGLLLSGLVGMPEAWLQQLRQSTLEGDLAWMAALIDGIHEHDAALAEGLRALADDFAHDTILSLIQRATGQDRGGDYE